jgi:hypothetical protein
MATSAVAVADHYGVIGSNVGAAGLIDGRGLPPRQFVAVEDWQLASHHDAAVFD